jgi:hypothetical protein
MYLDDERRRRRRKSEQSTIPESDKQLIYEEINMFPAYESRFFRTETAICVYRPGRDQWNVQLIWSSRLRLG